jgi:hypothetical protein
MDDYVSRTLTYLTNNGSIERVVDVDLHNLGRALVILGEPGMGKTWLLRRLASHIGYSFRSAASFVAHPTPAHLVSQGDTIVIDGLDELAAANESDPVYRVLGQLVAAGCPPFVLSCRAADWRGAVARQDIADEYGAQPLELTLEPFSAADAIAHLTHILDERRAEELVHHLSDRGVPDLFGNPLTLNLFGEVAAHHGPLPDTRSDLMRAAAEIMWRETSDRHDGSSLASLSMVNALNAAGATSAAYVLTGAEAISLRPSGRGQDRVLPVSELQALPGGQESRALIGSRLFQKIPDAEGQFKPIHRSVAEYLGARWLATIADDAMTRERILGMMTIDAGIPASLRGIHAWLVQDPAFADQVIATDPFGVLRYGDPDHLTVAQGRALLAALKTLEKTNPYFRAEDWGRHSARGLAQPELQDDIRRILLDPGTTFHLRTLLLGALKGTAVAVALMADLRAIATNTGGSYDYGERMEATEALAALDPHTVDWPVLIKALLAMADEDSHRLAVEAMDDIGYERLGGQLVAEAILVYLGLREDPAAEEVELSNTGTLFLLARRLPAEMVIVVLNALTDHVSAGDPFGDYRERNELGDTVTRLIARQLEIAPPEPLTLLKWMRVGLGQQGYASDDQKAISAYLAASTETRRAIQRHAILAERDEETTWHRIWRLSHLNASLALTTDDVLSLLSEFTVSTPHDDAKKDAWRDLTSFARRIEGAAPELIAAARPYAEGHADLEQFIEDVQKPLPPPEWQIQQDERRRERDLERAEALAVRRKNFGAHLAEIEAGDIGWIHPIALAYLALFTDIDNDASPAARITDFLGTDFVAPALAGLEAVLHRTDLPTAQQVADSYAESRRWNYMRPMIAAVVERLTQRHGLDDVPIDVLTAVRIGLHHDHFGDRIDQPALEAALDASLREHPAAYERYIRMLLEPMFAARQQHVMGLYGFVRSTPDRPLATRLAGEWLTRFDDLPVGVEIELLDVLVDTHQIEILRTLGEARAKAGYDSDERRRIWEAAALFFDFEVGSARLTPITAAERDFLWFLRHRLGGRELEDRPVGHADPRLLAWIFAQFRGLWVNRPRPTGVSGGNTNDFDATEFLQGVLNRLAGDPSAQASDAMTTLVAVEDGYSKAVLYAQDQQRKARREISFPGVSLDQLKAAVAAQPPRTSDDLLTVVRVALSQLQRELRGNDTDAVDKYWRDDGQPRNEDRCTDLLTEDLERHLSSLGIRRTPQADMPDGKIADLLYAVDGAALPVEAKGQWNDKLWTAAGTQLDDFYVRDWRVQDRGLYLIYWFGADVAANFKLKAPPGGAARPVTADELRAALIGTIPLERRGSIWVEVLDLTR